MESRGSIHCNRRQLSRSNPLFVCSDFEFSISNLTLHQLQFPSRGNLFPVNQLRPFINKLRHNADGNLRDTLRTNFDSHRTYHALKFLSSGDLFLREVFEDGPRFPRTSDHSDKEERLMNPIPEHKRVVSMTTRHNQREAWNIRQRVRSQ